MDIAQGKSRMWGWQLDRSEAQGGVVVAANGLHHANRNVIMTISEIFHSYERAPSFMHKRYGHTGHSPKTHEGHRLVDRCGHNRSKQTQDLIMMLLLLHGHNWVEGGTQRWARQLPIHTRRTRMGSDLRCQTSKGTC